MPCGGEERFVLDAGQLAVRHPFPPHAPDRVWRDGHADACGNEAYDGLHLIGVRADARAEAVLFGPWLSPEGAGWRKLGYGHNPRFRATSATRRTARM